MIRAAVLEKDKEKRGMLASALATYNSEITIVEFHDRYDFEESLDEDAAAYDAIILNTTIHKEGDGIKLARMIRGKNPRVMIVFITDTDQYYAQAFEVFATGYMIYPIDTRYLTNCFNFFLQKKSTERRESVILKEKGDRYRRIFCRNIVYVESRNREIMIHLDDGATVASYMKLDDIQEQIRSDLFLRCHQSYLINLYFVDEMAASMFSVAGEEIPVSRRYQKLSRDRYYNYMFRQL